MTQSNKRSLFPWLTGLFALAIIVLVALFIWPRFIDDIRGDRELQTVQVETITNVITVDASGVTMPNQHASLYWKTTGQVGEVLVEVGDYVQAGDVLMTVDPATAPPNLISARAELLAAEQALDALLNPDAMALAGAQKSLADAYTALGQAEQALMLAVGAAESASPDEKYQAVVDAYDALIEARAEYPLAAASIEVQMLYRAMRITDRYYQTYQDLDDEYQDSDRDEELRDAVEEARLDYEGARVAEEELADNVANEDADSVESIADAQADFEESVADFLDALEGEDVYTFSLGVVTARASLVMVEETLADAITRLEQLRFGPDPDDLAMAEARLQAAQATADLLVLTAPFDGEVLEVNYKPGDVISQAQAALVQADLSVLHVVVLIDETEVNEIDIGDVVSLVYNADPGLDLQGTVSRIARVGQSVQGLVKFQVEIAIDGTDEPLLIGATTDVSIEVEVEEDVLAVPLDALQSDSMGEFVHRVLSDGSVERVPVVSGSLRGDLVVVTGNLRAGDRIEIVEPESSSGFGPF